MTKALLSSYFLETEGELGLIERGDPLGKLLKGGGKGGLHGRLSQQLGIGQHFYLLPKTSVKLGAKWPNRLAMIDDDEQNRPQYLPFVAHLLLPQFEHVAQGLEQNPFVGVAFMLEEKVDVERTAVSILLLRLIQQIVLMFG